MQVLTRMHLHAKIRETITIEYKRGGVTMERMTMNVQELAQQMGISKPKAYELCRQAGFPAITVGKRVIIPVTAFENWLMESAAGKTETKARR